MVCRFSALAGVDLRTSRRYETHTYNDITDGAELSVTDVARRAGVDGAFL